MPSDYCPSRHRTVRRLTRVVNVGGVGVGGNNPIRVQSIILLFFFIAKFSPT